LPIHAQASVEPTTTIAPTTTAASTTTAAPTTTVAPTTTAAPTTTVAPTTTPENPLALGSIKVQCLTSSIDGGQIQNIGIRTYPVTNSLTYPITVLGATLVSGNPSTLLDDPIIGQVIAPGELFDVRMRLIGNCNLDAVYDIEFDCSAAPSGCGTFIFTFG